MQRDSWCMNFSVDVAILVSNFGFLIITKIAFETFEYDLEKYVGKTYAWKSK